MHLDGKLLPGNTGSGKADRFPIVITGLDTEQLFGVPKLISGTGINSATATVEALTDWNGLHPLKSSYFGTTAANTGKKTLI